jgi:hypothetical protein
MSNELAVFPTPHMWAMIKELDQSTFESRKFGTTRGEMVMRGLTAFEMGLPLSAGLRGIYVIDNKPAIAPKLVWALIMRHPDFDGYEEERLTTDKGAFLGYRLTLRRKNSPVETVTRQFTLDDARRIKQGGKPLADKDNWQNYPEQMCYWRALGAAQDVQWIDITFGMPRADELGAGMTPEGDIVIDGQYTVDTEPAVTMNDLLEKYDPDQIMSANGGKIPETVEELLAVQAVLNE